MADSKTRTTPPRAIFKDFSTAYQSIKSRSVRNLYDGSPAQELPLPAVPAQIRPASIQTQSRNCDSTDEEESAQLMAARTTSKQILLTGLPSTRRASTQAQQWADNEQAFLGLSQAISGRRRRRAFPIDVFARFSMPEVSYLYDNGTHDDVDLLRSPSHLASSSSASGDRHQSDHDSHSTGAGSHDSAEDFIDSYITKPEPQRPYISRRYSAMPRLQHVRSGLTDITTSTIGDLLSQYGEPEFRSLPTSMSQRLQTVVGKQHTGLPVEQVDGVRNVRPVGLAPENPFESPNAHIENVQPLRKPVPAAIAESHLPQYPAFIEPGLTLIDSTPLINYGDTKDLLELSSSSLDVARGALPSKSMRFSLGQRSPSSHSLLDINSVMQSHTSSDHFIVQDDSDSTSKQHTQHDLDQFSAMDAPTQPLSAPDLGSPELQGLNVSNRLSKTEIDLLKGGASRKHQTNPFRHDRDSAIGHSTKPDTGVKSNQLLQYLEEQRGATHMNALGSLYKPPIAAFVPTNVMPGVYRFSPTKQKTSASSESTHERSKELHTATRAEASENEEDDWETMTESRQTIHGHASVSHSVNTPSSNHTLRSLNNIGIHPADQRYKHVYRLHSPPGSAEAILIPTYDLGGASSFPYQNNSRGVAHSEPVYSHNIGESAQDRNPFSNSPSPTPIFTSAFSQTSLESVSSDEEDDYEDDRPVPYGVWRGPNLSVVYEQSGEKSESELNIHAALSAPSVVATAPSLTVSQAVHDDDRSSAWVDCGPGPEVSSMEDGSAWQHHGRDGLLTTRAKSTILASGADASLIKDLRRDDGSSPVSTSNSFAKTTRLGPHGNLTGSFNGTNMRFVGSSVIGSSPVTSTPNSVQQTPNRYEAPQPHIERTSSLVEESPSSIAWHRPRSYMIPRDKWSMAIPRPRPSSKHAVQILSIREDSRAALASQRALMEVRLAQSQSPNVMTSISRPREPFGRSGQVDGQLQVEHLTMPRSPIAPQDRTPDTLLPIVNPHTQLFSPHLHRLYRPPSSQAENLKSTKQKISWVVFAVFALFPPLLIFFGHNMFEPLMTWMTKGRIEHFGRRPKEVGKYVGYLLTGSILLGLGIAMIVIRTVPNSLPR